VSAYSLRWLAMAALAATLFAGCGRSDRSSEQRGPSSTGERRSTLSVDELRGVGFDQRVGERVPLEATFRDEHGRSLRLGDAFGQRPVVLALVYADCPMLCSLVLSGLFGSLRAVTPNVGDAFDVLVVSFDPKETPETARKRKEIYLKRYGRPGTDAGFRFLTGDAPSIAALTAAVGFRYQRDAATGQYAHPAGLVVLGQDGTIARYLYGSEFSPRDLQLAAAEASQGRTSFTNELLLLCYRYDPQKGSYASIALGAVRLGGALTVLAICGLISVTIRRDRRQRKRRAQAPPAPPAEGT